MAATSWAPESLEPHLLVWKEGMSRQRGKQILIGAILATLVAVTSWRCEVNVHMLMTGIHKGLPIVGMFIPPEWSGAFGMLEPLGVTVVLAILATLLSMVFSLPCALVASSNLAPPQLRLVMRSFIALERGVPEVVQLLLLIAVFGLGVIPGLIALSLSSIGMLAKLLADGIEEIEPHMLEAVAGVGATTSQVIRFAVIPQILPALFANGLFRFEFNVRQSALLGAVGGGGIGYVMRTAMLSLDYQRACMATLLTLALVFATERLSDFLRARILSGGQIK